MNAIIRKHKCDKCDKEIIEGKDGFVIYKDGLFCIDCELNGRFKTRLIVLCVICREGQGVIRMPSGNYMCLECYEGEMILSN